MGRILGIVLCLLFATQAAAQHWITPESCAVHDPEVSAEAIAPLTPERLRAEGRDVVNGVGRFWRITAPGGQVSHLWGTFHSNDPLILDVPQPVLGQLRAARLAAFESDPVAPSRRAYEIQQRGTLLWRSLGRPKLPEGIEPETLNHIRSRLDGLGFGRESLEYLTLGGLATVLLWNPCSDFAGAAVPIQDHYLYTLALISGVNVAGLEGQLAITNYFNLPRNADQATSLIRLMGSSLDPDQDPRLRSTIFALYLSGENGAMYALEKSLLVKRFGPEEGPKLQAHADAYMLEHRNRNWMEKLKPMLPEGGVFVAVGAFHLPGKAGLVALLREQGFEVERVALPREVR